MSVKCSSPLRNYKNIFGNEDVIRDVLCNAINSSCTRVYEKSIIIVALSELKLQNKEIDEYIYIVFNRCRSPRIKEGIFQYFYNVGKVDQYIDIYLKEYMKGYNNCSWIITNALCETHKYDVLCKIIESCSELDNSNDAYVCESLKKQATQYFKDGKDQILEIMYIAAIESNEKYNGLFTACKEFFSENKITSKVFEYAIEEYLDTKKEKFFYFIEDIIDDDCYRLFEKIYLADTIKYENILYSLILHMDENNKFYQRYLELLVKVGIVPDKLNRRNYNRERIQGIQQYFDTLFNKDQYNNLIYQLIDLCQTPKVKYKDLIDEFKLIKDYDQYDKKWELQRLVFDISNCNFDDDLVANFIKNVKNWGGFAINKMYYLLSNNSNICTSSQQELYIIDYCKNEIRKIDFQMEVGSGSSSSVSWRVRYVAFFSAYFNIKYELSIYHLLARVPNYYFEKQLSINDAFPNYILAHVGEFELNSIIEENIRKKNICFDVAELYLKYCKRHNMKVAVTLANDICNNVEAKAWTKRTALEYLKYIKGQEYIYDLYLETKDEVLFSEIVNLSYKCKNPRLEKRMCDVNSQSENGIKYLQELIEMESSYGLKKYYQLSKELMSIPDYTKGDNIFILTDAISSIQTVMFLPEIIQLKELLFLKGFKDNDTFGLHYSLRKAFENIALSNFEKTLKSLTISLNNPNISLKEKSFCNSLIESITQNHNKAVDMPWKISDVKCFFKKQRNGD